MKFFRQLKEAIFETITGDKPGSIQGQFWFDITAGEPKINDGTIVKTFVVTSDPNAVPLNDQSTDGSWRMIIVGAEVQFQRRESAVWVKKGAFTA